MRGRVGTDTEKMWISYQTQHFHAGFHTAFCAWGRVRLTVLVIQEHSKIGGNFAISEVDTGAFWKIASK